MNTPASRLYVGGDVHGHVVIGTNNLVVGVDGSSLSALTGPPPPTPRRAPVRLASPRAGSEPVGRDTELGSIRGWLDQRLPVEIYGEPGIGKSTLLRRVAAERGSSTDVVYLSSAGLARDDLLQEMFQAFYDVASYRPEPGQMRRLLGSVQALLVLDDFAGSPEDLTAVLDTVPSCDVLLAGDQCHMFSDGRALALRGLGEDDARVVLTRHLGRRLTSDEFEAAGRLWAAAQGNPRVLVQTARAVHSLWEAEPAGELPRVSLDVAEPALAPVLAGRLGADARRVVAVLAVLGGDVPVYRPALKAMTGSTEAGVEELLAAGLVENDGAGCRLAGSLGGAVARHADDPPTIIDLAADLTRWVASASPRDVARSATMILRVLDRLTAAGEPAAAVPLARAAAPRLALSLRLDAWSQVLSRGRAAARSARAAADEAYFTREEEVRRRALAWIAVGAAGGATAAIVGTGPIHGADVPHADLQQAGPPPPGPHTDAQPPPPPRPRQPLPREVLAHPVAIVIVVVVVVAATVGVLRGAFPARHTQPVPPVTTLVPSPVPPPTIPPSTAESTTPVAGPPPEVIISISTQPSPVPCIPGGHLFDFTSVPVGSRGDIPYTFYSHKCHTDGLDTAHMAILGPGAAAFSLTRSSCPDVILPGGDTCDITITFAPRSAGRFDATLFIPEAGVGTDGHGEAPIVGVGVPPPTVTSPPEEAPTPSPTPVGDVLLGDLPNLSAYCGSHNAGTSDYPLGRLGPNRALNNWICTGGAGPSFLIDMTDACRWQYPGHLHATARPLDVNDAFSWRCYE